MKDAIGDRMKDYYENRTRFLLSRRSYTIIRVDGKAFHTYTRGLDQPFDKGLVEDMNYTAAYLCKNIMGAKLAYVQSDEISIILTDFDEIATQAWFDNNLQKMCSVSASMATRAFNQARLYRQIGKGEGQIDLSEIEAVKWAEFDSRVFQIPFKGEVENYFIWRQADAVRNSISSVAQSLYSHKDLDGKTTDMMQEMIFQQGINWNDYPAGLKRGRCVIKEEYELAESDAVRTRWITIDPPIFTQDRLFLVNRLP